MRRREKRGGRLRPWAEGIVTYCILWSLIKKSNVCLIQKDIAIELLRCTRLNVNITILQATVQSMLSSE